MDLYWSPRLNIRGIKFRHVIGLFGIKARWPSGDHLIQRNRENGLFIIYTYSDNFIYIFINYIC
jgi:hypothetical protein